jgi:hypothetical protein
MYSGISQDMTWEQQDTDEQLMHGVVLTPSA